MSFLKGPHADPSAASCPQNGIQTPSLVLQSLVGQLDCPKPALVQILLWEALPLGEVLDKLGWPDTQPLKPVPCSLGMA